MSLETVSRQLANVYWRSVPQPDCTWKEGTTVCACITLNLHISCFEQCRWCRWEVVQGSCCSRYGDKTISDSVQKLIAVDRHVRCPVPMGITQPTDINTGHADRSTAMIDLPLSIFDRQSSRSPIYRYIVLVRSASRAHVKPTSADTSVNVHSKMHHLFAKFVSRHTQIIT